METRILDHIIHLSSPGQLHTAVQQFEKLGFKVLPGGEHADGLTYNALVVLQDGVYLELIAFTHDLDHYEVGSSERKAREEHWWANKRPGWIDWANLALDDQVGEAINGRGVVQYRRPLVGGRIKPNGDQLQWRVMFPEAWYWRAAGLPFFCQDITPRERRVPLFPSTNTMHPSNASGIAHISMTTGRQNFATVQAELSSALGIAPLMAWNDGAKWELLTPVDGRHPQLELCVADDGSELETRITKVGFWADRVVRGEDSGIEFISRL